MKGNTWYLHGFRQNMVVIWFLFPYLPEPFSAYPTNVNSFRCLKFPFPSRSTKCFAT